MLLELEETQFFDPCRLQRVGFAVLAQRCEVVLARASRPRPSLTNATALSRRGRISGGCSGSGVAKISSSEALDRLDGALEAPELVDSASGSVLRSFVARAFSANSL